MTGCPTKRGNARACIILSSQVCVSVRAGHTPASAANIAYYIAVGRAVRSLNSDPETTARPLCAWPSTTGRKRVCIHRASSTGRANERRRRFFPDAGNRLSLPRLGTGVSPFFLGASRFHRIKCRKRIQKLHPREAQACFFFLKSPVSRTDRVH